MLAVQDATTGNQGVVANDRAYTCPDEVSYGVKLMFGHYKVSFDWPFPN